MSHFVLTIIAILCIVIGSVHSAGCTSDDYATSSLLPYLPLAFSAVLIAQRYLVTNVIKILMENGWPLLTSIMLCMHVREAVPNSKRRFFLYICIISLFVWEWYGKHWIASNAVLLVGIYFVISNVAVESESHNQHPQQVNSAWKSLSLLMIGAIVYDAFFVFGTTLMEPSGWNIPQFIQFDGHFLGGGDIALPGLVIAYLYRYDLRHPHRRKIFFYAALAAYAVAMHVCTFMLIHFRASQPALIYIFPAIFLSTGGACWYTGEFRNFI